VRTKLSIRSLLFALIMLITPAASYSQVGIVVSFGPPELPVYDQPVCPGDGYIWNPGYWGWDADADDYYWIPGTWVLAPEAGFLWTPGYWAWGGSGFVFTDGYWGPVVGFYGGINYGFGYFGHGFEGGRWDHDHFFYNRAVTHVDVTVIHNVYETKVTNVTISRVSFNGGNGGVNERPTPQEEAAAHERHMPPVSAQAEHVQAARSNTALRASTNHGKPPIAATPRPADFSASGVVTAKEGGRYNPPPKAGNTAATRTGNGATGRAENNAATGTENNNAARSTPPSHVKDLPAYERPAPANTGNPNVDKKYQQQQDKLVQKQQQERQKLQQKQEQDHQRAASQNANDAKKQQMEQQHQQQTQQLSQKHVQQQQQLQQRQQPPPQSHAAAPKAKP
jgi:hypothetical protein